MTRKLLMTATAVAGCGFFILIGQPAAPPAVYTAAQAAAGRTAYQSSCASCHADTLLGRNEVPPLAGADFMTRWGARTTKDLYGRIHAAPPDRRLDEETYLNLMAYILRANGARPGTEALTAATTVEIRSIANTPQTMAAEAGNREAPLAVYTAAQAAAGRTAYRTSCAHCHTDTLLGHDEVPPLAGADFMVKWGPQTTTDLYHRIQRIELLGTADSDHDATDLNLIAFILQANGARPGSQALTKATAVEIRQAAGIAPQATLASPAGSEPGGSDGAAAAPRGER